MKQRDSKIIKQFAEKRFSHVNTKNMTSRFIWELRCFKEDLVNANMLSDHFSKDELTHSKKTIVEGKHYVFYLDDMITFLCRYFDAKHVFISCNKKNGIIFIGCPHNIHAVSTVFSYINPIMIAIREQYQEKIKSIKKQEMKDKKINHFMSNWVDKIIKEYAHKNKSDFHFYEEFNDYVKVHLKTHDDYRDLRIRALEIVKMFYDETIDPTINWGEFKEIVHDKFTEEAVNKTIDEYLDYMKQDVIVLFGDEFEEDDDDDW